MAARTSILFILSVFFAASPSYAGYTHYFTWKLTWEQIPDLAALPDCIAEMRLIIEARKDILVVAEGEGESSEDWSVEFNGVGSDAHEPFIFPGVDQLNFCKTQWKPYDEVVVACLLVARDHFPSEVLEISSDGTWGDWSDGAALYSSVLGRPARNPLGDKFDYDRLYAVGGAVIVLVVVVSWVKARRR